MLLLIWLPHVVESEGPPSFEGGEYVVCFRRRRR